MRTRLLSAPSAMAAVLVMDLLLLLSSGVRTSAGAAPSAGPGPLDISGEINGAPFRIVVPAAWNGTLIEYVRGYVFVASNRTPEIAPSPGVAAALLGEGYALAGSARKRHGWAVEEGLDDVVALANYFRDTVARPRLTLLYGSSLGTVIALKTAERTGGVFDGYLVQCALGAGASRHWDGWGDVLLAYDVAFGMPAAWGVPGDVRDDLDFNREVRPLLTAQAGDPANLGRFEFIRLVSGIPGSGITPPPGFFPTALGLPLQLATGGLAELERRAGGPVVQNVNHTYELTPSDRTYLAGLGVDVDSLLATMNARRTIKAPPNSRNYLEHFADYGGQIKRPVLTLHTKVDPAVPVSAEAAYRATVDTAGQSGLLLQVYTDGVGHCNFSDNQRLAGIHALEGWAKTGTRPAASAFPADAHFLPDFRPPAWHQP